MSLSPEAGLRNTDAVSGNQSSTTSGTTPNSSTKPTDPSSTRLWAAGIPLGPTPQKAGPAFNMEFKGLNGSTVGPVQDWRVRISLQPAAAAMFYSSAITKPLEETNGVVFPYTPQIQISHAARYSDQPITHSNYKSFFYDGSEVQAINITADFTVQNIGEGQYLMAAVHFFRSCTKMFYGNDALAGTPPPMVFLDGYGKAYLPHVPCVITQFSHTMPADVDYVEIPVATAYQLTSNPNQQQSGLIDVSNYGMRTRLPTASSISVILQPVYSRNNISNNFSLENFVSGSLLKDPNSPIGGFL